MSNGSGLFTTQQARVPHLAKVTGEIGDLRRDVAEELLPLAAMTVDEYTDPATGAVDDLEAATATEVAPRTVTTFEAAGLASLAAHPRNVTITNDGSGTPADAPADCVVTGTYLGLPQSETIVVPQSAATTDGVKPYDVVTSVAYAAADGTAAAVSIGIGDGLGTAKIPKERAGAVNLVREVEAGSLVTTGALTAAQLYTPSTVPDASNDYAIYYEYDPTA